MKLWFSLLKIVPNCNCSDWSFPCQVAVPGCTFLESSCQNSSAISRNDARKKKVFFAHVLEVLEIRALKCASAPILKVREIKIFRGLVYKKKKIFLQWLFSHFSEDADKKPYVLWIKSSNTSSGIWLSRNLSLLRRHHPSLRNWACLSSQW